MQFKKLCLVSFLMLVTILSSFSLINRQRVHASYKGHYTTPTELRGNWYQFDKSDHKFYTIHIYKHMVIINHLKITPRHHKTPKNEIPNDDLLYITKEKHWEHGALSKVNYIFTSKQKFGNAMEFWLANKKVH